MKPIAKTKLSKNSRHLNLNLFGLASTFFLGSFLAFIAVEKAEADHCSSIDITCPRSHRNGGLIKIDPPPDSMGSECQSLECQGRVRRPSFSPPYLPSYHAQYPMFDARWYLSNNSDVNNACKGNLECAREHYLANGLKECRNASRYFHPRWYLDNNPDVKNVFVDCRGASEHWSNAGRKERRPGAPGVPAP